MIAIVDYGMGNLFSIYNGLRNVDGDPVIVSNQKDLTKANGIVIPGVGSFGDGMRNLSPFVPRLLNLIDSGVPTLGICLGMQMFFDESEEGKEEGLGLIEGEVSRLPRGVRIPQMGWNSLEIKREVDLLKGIKNGNYFYFVHSYYCLPRNEKRIVAITEYGTDVTAVVKKGNIYAVQFHPEKSSKKGLRILKNFVEICKC